MSSTIGLSHEIQENLRTLYGLLSIHQLGNYHSQERRQSAPVAGVLDKGSLIVLCIAIPLVCIFFLLWLFREKILGKDDDPVNVFRDSTPPIRRSSSESGRSQRDTNLSQPQRDLAAHEHSRTRPTSSEEVRQLC
jgi:hypothetical protein